MMPSDTAVSGFCVPYEVKTAGDKGQGVFATTTILRHTTVWQHIPGQVNVYDHAGFNAALAVLPEAEIIYLLTHCYGLSDWPHMVIQVRDAGTLINHDPSPTLITRMRLAGAPAPTAPPNASPAEIATALLGDRYALIATRDIAPGEEFTNNYTAELSDPPFFEALYDRDVTEEDYL